MAMFGNKSAMHEPLTTPLTFTFNLSQLPPLPSPSSTSSFDRPTRSSAKRGRARSDVDGEGSGHAQKKKRRLRLDLITSRLSRPFAAPTTYIAGRGRLRAGRWLRQRMAGKPPLRKLAVLNWSRACRGPEVDPGYQEAFSTFVGDEDESVDDADGEPFHNGATVPIQEPMQPRPGLSNYQAIDDEDDPPDADDTGWATRMDWSEEDPISLEDREEMGTMDAKGTQVLPIAGLPELVKDQIVVQETSRARLLLLQPGG